VHWLPKRRAGRGDEIGIRHRRSVDRDLVGAGLEQRAHVLFGAYPAADGERHECLLGRCTDDVENRAAVLVARRDVEERQLVGAFAVVARGALHGIAGIAQADELDAFDDAPAFDVEARDDALGEHVSVPLPRQAGRRA
jgi:hypothetical protein